MNDPMNQSQMMNPSQMMMSQPPPVQILSQPPPPPPQLVNQQSMVNPSQAQGMGHRSYGMWPPPRHLKFPNPMLPQQGFMASNPSRQRNWKGKKGNDARKDGRRKENPAIAGAGAGAGGGVAVGGGYKPPTLNELQYQNRLKARRFYPNKKKNYRFAPYAPRNTTSFIIRAKKSGGIASLVSPCPVTPAVLPTPIFSPSREVLGDMAKEEWGVDGYGSMKGLIRLRSPGNEVDGHEEEEEEEEGGSSESDVEEHVEVERRLDHDLSRFEMIYPNYGVDYNNVLENRVEDQDNHIAQLEEENLILKERLFLMERELVDLRRRMQCLERQNQAVEDVNKEVLDNASDNESEGREDVRSNEEVVEENNAEGGECDSKGENNEHPQMPKNEFAMEHRKEESVHVKHEEVLEEKSKDGEVGNSCSGKNIGCSDDVGMEDLAHPQGE